MKLLYKMYSDILNSSIKKKMFITLFMIIFLLTLFASCVIYIFINTLYMKQIKDSSQKELKQAKNILESTLNNNYYASYIVQNSDMIKNILLHNSETFEQQYKDMREMEKQILTLMMPISLYQISIYVKDELSYSNNNVIFRKNSDLNQYEEFNELKSSYHSYIWLKPELLKSGDSNNLVPVLSFIRKIGDDNAPVGYQRVSIKVSSIIKILLNAKNVKGSFCYLYNEDLKDSICSTDEAKIKIIQKIPDNHMKTIVNDRTWKQIEVSGKHYLVYAERVKSVNWYIASVLPVSIINKGVYRLLFIWLLLAFMIGITALFIGNKFSKNITNRIFTLEDKMNHLAEGKFEKIDQLSGQDEIGHLFNHYNNTIDKMQAMVEREYENVKFMKTAELKMLQAQINPHFLYNTLDLIYWEALDSNSTKIAGVTQALAKFYKLSLNSGKEIVFIKEEIDHVISYIEIQNYRFEQFIKTEIEIPSELYQYGIIKITLQPLIENAIQHGLTERMDRSGSIIRIRAWMESAYIYFEIKDNGVGMTEEKLKDIVSETTTSDYHGYGIKNINCRLKLYYGEECGLSFTSVKGEGTTVTIKIKANKI